MKASELRHESDLGIRGIEIIAKNELVAFLEVRGYYFLNYYNLFCMLFLL